MKQHRKPRYRWDRATMITWTLSVAVAYAVALSIALPLSSGSWLSNAGWISLGLIPATALVICRQLTRPRKPPEATTLLREGPPS